MERFLAAANETATFTIGSLLVSSYTAATIAFAMLIA